MLGEVLLDLGHARSGPVLEPGLGEVVLDPVETAFTHADMIDTATGRLYVGTVHSFCLNRILRPYASVSGRPELAKRVVMPSSAAIGVRERAMASVGGPGSGPDPI